MVTIRTRKNKDGSVMYTAQLRIKRDGVQVYQESASFSRRKAVEAWAKRRETELSEPGALEREQCGGGATLVEMIERYIEESDPTNPLGKTKKATRAPWPPATWATWFAGSISTSPVSACWCGT
ncbi:MAG TPA: hypothetical protein VIO83_00435 [Pseudomonas sp.]